MEGAEKGYNEPPPKYEPPVAGYPADPSQQPGMYPPGGSYPPPGAYPQSYQGSAQTTVVVHQPSTMPLPSASYRYMQYPALIVCQHCQATVTTATEYQVGLLTWAIAGLICLFGRPTSPPSFKLVPDYKLGKQRRLGVVLTTQSFHMQRLWKQMNSTLHLPPWPVRVKGT
ncbi:hypothetical protein Btru_045051 [Bulinus truncatus]|nr:hypothetical protein Btru_045051 [Bulinus truncatus]